MPRMTPTLNATHETAEPVRMRPAAAAGTSPERRQMATTRTVEASRIGSRASVYAGQIPGAKTMAATSPVSRSRNRTLEAGSAMRGRRHFHRAETSSGASINTPMKSLSHQRKRSIRVHGR